MEINIRKGEKKDLAAVLGLIRELAVYERAGDEVSINLDQLEKDGFGSNPLFEFIVAEAENKLVGMAFYFHSYSTWKGRCIYLEDIIVSSAYRGQGIGEKLFTEMMNISHKVGAKRLSWQVLDWNTPAINFYKKFNANLDGEWLNGRLREEDIQKLLK